MATLADGAAYTASCQMVRSIESYQVPLPPLPEQQRIVAILDEAFAGLATATANAEKNLQERPRAVRKLSAMPSSPSAEAGREIRLSIKQRLQLRSTSPYGDYVRPTAIR